MTCGAYSNNAFQNIQETIGHSALGYASII
jgi:hypothetical protein